MWMDNDGKKGDELMSEGIHAETIKRFFRTMIPGTVLIIDDDKNVSDSLSNMGFSVTDKVESDQFDYVLMSMNDIEKSEFLSSMAAIGKYGVVVSSIAQKGLWRLKAKRLGEKKRVLINDKKQLTER